MDTFPQFGVCFAVWARLAVFSAFALPIAFVDAREMRIPDALSLGSAASLVIFDAIFAPREFGSHVAAAFLLFSVFWLLRRATCGLGGGDVKYAPSIGLFLGLPSCLASLFLSAATAIVCALCFRGRGDRIAFGPFLIGGAFAAYALELARN